MHLALHSVNLLFKFKLGNFGLNHHQYVWRRSGEKYISKGL